MLENMRIQGLRSLMDTGYIPLKPITILVGKNSSGKSTLARAFPLIRQSVEQRTKGPILWYGNLVDFGSFNDTINYNSINNEIIFSFKVSITEKRRNNDSRIIPTTRNRRLNLLSSGHAEVSLFLKESPDGGTFASKLDLEMFGLKCRFTFNEDSLFKGIEIDDVKHPIPENLKVSIDDSALLPIVRLLQIQVEKIDGREYRYFVESNIFKDRLRIFVRKIVHGKTSDATVNQTADRLRFGSSDELLAYIKKLRIAPESWRRWWKDKTTKSPEFIELTQLLFACHLNSILNEIDAEIYKFFSGVKYIEPLRATAQRYYRKQELAVDEMDSKGENVAMFLNSLSRTEKAEYEKWMQDELGFTVRATSNGGHVALTVKDSNSSKYINLSDMGFGFSQILPITIQLWAASRSPAGRRRSKISKIKETSCIVIEQPELHLHPDFQARIGEVIAKSIIGNNPPWARSAPIFCETHSPHLINRIGELVANETISHTDVQIILFSSSSGITTCQLTSFDHDGVLIDWPYGFFEPDQEGL